LFAFKSSAMMFRIKLGAGVESVVVISVAFFLLFFLLLYSSMLAFS